MINVTKSEEIALTRLLFSKELCEEDKRVISRFKMVLGKRHSGLLSDEDNNLCKEYWSRLAKKPQMPNSVAPNQPLVKLDEKKYKTM